LRIYHLEGFHASQFLGKLKFSAREILGMKSYLFKSSWLESCQLGKFILGSFQHRKFLSWDVSSLGSIRAGKFSGGGILKDIPN